MTKRRSYSLSAQAACDMQPSLCCKRVACARVSSQIPDWHSTLQLKVRLVRCLGFASTDNNSVVSALEHTLPWRALRLHNAPKACNADSVRRLRHNLSGYRCKLLETRSANAYFLLGPCVCSKQRQRYRTIYCTPIAATACHQSHRCLTLMLFAAKVAELQELSTGETFVNKILGSDCYTKSLDILDSDCSRMDSEKKSRLAMALANCHLAQLGLPTFTCKHNMNLKQCADNMRNERMYSTYLEFLSNIES